LEEIDARITAARAEVQRLQSEMSAHRSRIEFNRQRAQEITELVERYTADIAAAEVKRAEQENQISEADALIESTNRLLETRQQELRELSAKAAELRTDRSDREAELQQLQVALTRSENRSSSLGDELASTKSRRDATLARISDLANEIGTATATRDEAHAAVERAKATAETEQQTLETLLTALRTAEQELRNRQQTLAEVEKEAFRIERTIAEKQSRLEVPAPAERRRRRPWRKVRKPFSAASTIRSGFAPPSLARSSPASMSTANTSQPSKPHSGRNMHAVVLQDPALAGEIFRNVAGNKLGQAALALPQLTAPESDDHLVDLPAGATAWARDKVSAPEHLAPLVRRLLRGVAIVPDLDTAVRLKSEHRVLQFATMAGEFVSTAGVVFGGTVSNQTESLLGRKTLISETAAEVARLEQELTFARARRDEVRASVESGTAELADARTRHQAAHVSHSNAAAQLMLLSRDVRAAEDRLRQLRLNAPRSSSRPASRTAAFLSSNRNSLA
jgi:chromosome segregation protein